MNKNAENIRFLIIDDQQMNLDMITVKLETRGHQTLQATSGPEGLDILRKEHPHFVLLDITMPDMDGIEVLKEIRETYSQTQLPVIMVTAIDESEDIVKALEAGANDYVTKPLDFPVLMARINTHVELSQATEALRRAYQSIMKDLKAAARIQQTLLPVSSPEIKGAHFSWVCKPCQTLAGDMLNIFQIDEQRVVLYLLDVSGHGAQAALLTSTLSHVLTNTTGNGSVIWDEPVAGDARELASPVSVAKRLNRLFPMDNENCQYFTILYGVLDLDALTFKYVTAGHPGPLVLNKEGKSSVRVSPGVPIGWLTHDPDYEEKVIELKHEDRVYLYCDGVIEARNDRHQQFGPECMAETLKATRDQSLEGSLSHLLEAVEKWTVGPPQDDLSILAFEINQSG